MLLDRDSEETEELKNEQLVRTITRSKSKVDKAEKCSKAEIEQDMKNEDANNAPAPATRPLGSCLKKTGSAELRKKPVAFKSKVAEEIVEKDDERGTTRSDEWSAADVLERASIHTESKKEHLLDEASLIAKKKETHFFGESADVAAWTAERWVQEQSTKESVAELERMQQEGVPLKKNGNGLDVKVYFEKRKTGQRESFATREFSKIYVPPSHIAKIHSRAASQFSFARTSRRDEIDPNDWPTVLLARHARRCS